MLFTNAAAIRWLRLRRRRCRHTILLAGRGRDSVQACRCVAAVAMPMRQVAGEVSERKRGRQAECSRQGGVQRAVHSRHAQQREGWGWGGWGGRQEARPAGHARQCVCGSAAVGRA